MMLVSVINLWSFRILVYLILIIIVNGAMLIMKLFVRSVMLLRVTRMDDRRVYLSITWEQGKQLLVLLDALEVVFKSDLPYWVRGLRSRLYNAMHPGS